MNIEEDNNSSESNKESNIFLSIKSPYILKLILDYQNIPKFMKIILINKQVQKKIGLSLFSYKIFSYYKTKKLNLSDYLQLIKFLIHQRSKLKNELTLNEIHDNVSLCVIDYFYSNPNIKHKNILDLNLFYDELYSFYSTFILRYGTTFKINILYSDKYFTQKIYETERYKNFIKEIYTNIKGLSFEIQDKNIRKNLANNNFNNCSFSSFVYINKLKFTRMKFGNEEIKILYMFPREKIYEIYFYSCKFSLRAFELFIKYFTYGLTKNNLHKIVINDCHIIDKNIINIIEDLNLGNLVNLEELNLNENKITDILFEELVKLYDNENNDNFNLKYLNLSKNNLSCDSVNNLSTCSILNKPKLNGLIFLDLSYNNIGNSIKLLFTWKNSTLSHLKLLQCGMQNDSKVNIDNNNKSMIDDAKLILGLTNLEYLDISKNQISPFFLYFMFCDIPKLYQLKVSSCSLDYNSFDIILAYKKETKINKLILSHNKINTNIIRNLYEYNIFENLYELDLFYNALNNDIVKYLVDKKKTIKLKTVNVDLNYGVDEENVSLLYDNYRKYIK